MSEVMYWLLTFIFLIHFSVSDDNIPEFDCADGKSVFLHQVCDGSSDCPDSSDESNTICRYYRCTKYQFRCSYGGCISEEKECDGHIDCLDQSDENACGVVLNSCRMSEFQCQSGNCIPRSEVCDGKIHCSDKSDESLETCKSIVCPSSTFPCQYGACVPLSAKCNGSTECIDGSDETHPTCKQNTRERENIVCNTEQFACKNGECINVKRKCDGQIHCSDASDEDPTVCFKRQCSPGQMRCRSGQCVAGVMCDGRPDCADGTDEHPWICGRATAVSAGGGSSGGGGSGWEVAAAAAGGNRGGGGSGGAPEPSAGGGCPVSPDALQPAACSLPPAAPGARYTSDACRGCVAGSRVPEGSALAYTCDEGHALVGPARPVCVNAAWRPQLPVCAPVASARAGTSCPAVASSISVDATCEAPRGMRDGGADGGGGGRVPCGVPAAPGTVAIFRCREFYTPLVPTTAAFAADTDVRAVCLRNGSWSADPIRCSAVCGKMGPEITPLIVNGQPSQYGMWPWLAALYVLQSGEWVFWCGGSLISDSVIITAAHCTWNQNPENFRVAFGKYYSRFDRKQDLTQIREVKEILVQPAYQDQLGNYGSDIALIILKIPVNLTLAVRPVCIDWNLDFIDQHLTENNTGLVFGWGVNENDTHSEFLRKTTLMVRGYEQCIAEQSRDFKKYITFTTFCAGYQNGTGVCNGDSGGGLVFSLPNDNETWVLQGLVSVSPRRRGTSFCDPTKYTVFTKVGIYVKWLKYVLSSKGIRLWL